MIRTIASLKKSAPAFFAPMMSESLGKRQHKIVVGASEKYSLFVESIQPHKTSKRQYTVYAIDNHSYEIVTVSQWCEFATSNDAVERMNVLAEVY